jgi:hypothetical protein
MTGIRFGTPASRGTLSLLSCALVAARLPLGAVEVESAFLALFQEQLLAVKNEGLGALDFHQDWRFHMEAHSIRFRGAR